MSLIWYGVLIVGGYVLAIYTWPAVRTFANGVEHEIAALREKARALEAKIKAFTGR